MHRIEYWRNKLAISQSELARRAGISQSYISKLEKGTKIPSLPMLYKIAAAMEACPKDLLSCVLNCPNCKSSCRKCNTKKPKIKKALDRG